MEAKELRLGNLVCTDNSTEYYLDIEIVTIEILKEINEGIEFYNPIPLTEEWLLKSGFPEHKSTIDLLWDYTIYLERQHNELFLVHIDNIYVYKLEYVHTLQNLYFALKDEELTSISQ